jgi:hypothetical protein
MGYIGGVRHSCRIWEAIRHRIQTLCPPMSRCGIDPRTAGTQVFDRKQVASNRARNWIGAQRMQSVAMQTTTATGHNKMARIVREASIHMPGSTHDVCQYPNQGLSPRIATENERHCTRSGSRPAMVHTSPSQLESPSRRVVVDLWEGLPWEGLPRAPRTRRIRFPGNELGLLFAAAMPQRTGEVHLSSPWTEEPEVRHPCRNALSRCAPP